MPSNMDPQGNTHVCPASASPEAPMLGPDLYDAIAQSCGDIVVDLQHVVTLNAAALSVFIAAHNTLHEQGRRLTMTHVAEDLLQLLQLLRLDQHFQVVARQN